MIEKDVKTTNPLPVLGAFEIDDGKREELITLTRNGRLLEVGDQLPAIKGVDPKNKPFILHTVNAFGTATCDECIGELEAFHLNNPDIPIYSLSKQSPEEIETANQKSGRPITHPCISIDQETAVDLGIAVAPGEGADKEFWPSALRRLVAVIDSDGKVIHVQHPDDQDQLLDFSEVYDHVLAAAQTK